MISYIFYDINGHFVKIAAIRLDGGISLSKNQSHSSSYSRISFKKEENGSEKRIDKTLLPLPGGQLFQIHGSKFKLHPVRYLSQACVSSISQTMLLFCIRKDTFNCLFPSLVHPLVDRSVTGIVGQFFVVFPDMSGDCFYAVLALCA